MRDMDSQFPKKNRSVKTKEFIKESKDANKNISSYQSTTTLSKQLTGQALDQLLANPSK